MANEPHTVVSFWQAFAGERITRDDYSSSLADARVHKVCVTLIPGRCGSTLFGQLVKQWGCFGIGREAFNERRQDQWRKVATSGLDFFSRIVRRQAMAGIYWLKITPDRHDHLLTGLDPAIPLTWRYSAILRRDIVAQAMSFVYAVNSQVWHSSCPKFDPTTPISLPGSVDGLADQTLDWIKRLVACEARIREILAERGDERPLVLFYEDIVRDPEAAVLWFYRDAGVMPPANPPALQQTLSRLQKDNEDQLRERLWSRHGDEVRRVEEARATSVLAWAAGIGKPVDRQGSAGGPGPSQHPAAAGGPLPPNRRP